MDVAYLTRRAERVSRIFDVLATAVAAIGGLVTVLAFIAVFTSGAAMERLLLAVGVAIYTVLTWAGIQLASLVAGYIAARTAAS